MPLPILDLPHLNERSLLLLLADRRMYEPFTAREFLAGEAGLREALAVALGRIGDPRGRPTLEALLLDAEPAVRCAAAFALGEVGNALAAPALLATAHDPDREAGSLAVEALGKLGASSLEVASALAGLPGGERRARLLPHLFRFHDPGKLELAREGLAAGDPPLHARAAYALARDALPEAAPDLRRLLADPDPWVRGWAARGLGQVGEPADLEAIAPLLADSEAGPVIQALRAAQRLIGERGAAPPPSWRPRLVALLDADHPGVRLTAVEAAGAWLPDEDLATVLRRRAVAASGRESELALLALAAAGDGAAAELVPAAAAAPDPSVRARGAEAAGRLGAAATLERLAADPAPMVRVAALEVRLAAAGTGAAGLARQALADPDPAVRGTALDWLAEHPELPGEELIRLVAAPLDERLAEERHNLIQAIVARAVAEPLERGSLVIALENLANDRDYLVRRWAAEGLAALDRPLIDPGQAEVRKQADDYRLILQVTARPRHVELRTRHGALRIRLACPEAPLTCLHFLQLAAQGFYDGLAFHRVVPDFVVQGGDPRGDGWGGPGYALRDEVNRLRYSRGVVGMALSGPHTGGSQFFITLSPQPHLDGGYTAFGEVVAGGEILDRIEQGDRIESIIEVP